MAPNRCVMGHACSRHRGVHGGEAEELRSGLEKILEEYGPMSADSWMRTSAGVPYEELRRALRQLLDEVDARDSLSFLEVAADKRGRALP